MKPKAHTRKRATRIFDILTQEFGKPACPLLFASTEQLAVAVMLSAQCTDERVNIVTPALFSKYPDMPALANAPLSDIETLIYSTGFFRNKARNIQALAKILTEKHGGLIPGDFELLVSFPGIGRKTANVIMAEAFNEAPGITVDTHVKRIAALLEFTDSNNAVIVERELMQIFPRALWRDLPLLLIFHGRKTCIARRPKCNQCGIAKLCPSAGISNPKSPS
jgi:endonuclease III